VNAPETTIASALVLLAPLAASAFFSRTELAVFSLPDAARGTRDRRTAVLAELREDPTASW